jgi:hypothetical protein
MRKHYLLLILAAALLSACNANSNGSEADEALWPQTEITQTDLGFGAVYGVRITDFTPTKTAKAYAVHFSLNDRVWLDTIYTSLGAKDTVVSEVFFSDASTQQAGTPQHRIEVIDAE